MRGNGSGSVWIRGSGSVWIRVPTGGSHVRSLWGLILTLAYITKRLSEEEKEKKRHPVGGQTALLIYSEGRGLHTSDPPPFRLLLDGSAFFINLHQLLATGYRLLPPPTGFHRLRHLARLLPASTAFATSRAYYLLSPPSPPRAPLDRDKRSLRLSYFSTNQFLSD